MSKIHIKLAPPGQRGNVEIVSKIQNGRRVYRLVPRQLTPLERWRNAGKNALEAWQREKKRRGIPSY